MIFLIIFLAGFIVGSASFGLYLSKTLPNIFDEKLKERLGSERYKQLEKWMLENE